MKDMYFTITGCNHYLGNEFMEKGMKVKLKKEPDNEFDTEAIMVQIKGIGKCGYVANSPFTVKGESLSAVRLYGIGRAYGKLCEEALSVCEYCVRNRLAQSLPGAFAGAFSGDEIRL